MRATRETEAPLLHTCRELKQKTSFALIKSKYRSAQAAPPFVRTEFAKTRGWLGRRAAATMGRKMRRTQEGEKKYICRGPFAGLKSAESRALYTQRAAPEAENDH